jgi:copper chaperone CopZ/uncharacterized membrane protein HdeD (DUF308 family)
MKHVYKISGMTCGNCAAKVKLALESIPEVNSAEVAHETGTTNVEMSAHVPNITIEKAISAKGNYHLVNDSNFKAKADPEDNRTFLETYKPILLIAGFLVMVSALAARGEEPFWSDFMRFFMAGFFLVFSFFKFLDVKGFAQSYMTYDILAKKWNGWGTIYPFVEFGLGLAYLLNLDPFAVNLTTIIVMGFSSIGVIQSVLNKKTIKCACLGTVFNLPMSTVTIIEDLLMVLMAAYMLLA